MGGGNYDSAKEVGLPYTVPNNVKKMIVVAAASMAGSSSISGGNPNRTVRSTTTITKNGAQVCKAEASHSVPQGTCNELSVVTAIIDVNPGDYINASNGVKSESGSGGNFTNSVTKGSSKAFIL